MKIPKILENPENTIIFSITPALKRIITSGGTRLRFLHIHNVPGLKTSEIAK